MAASMQCHCLRSSQLPHTTKLFATFLDDFSRVARFYAHVPTIEGCLAAAREVHFDASVRASVVEALRNQNRQFGGGAATARNLDRLAAGAFAVVTGQQVGLFSGPSYSFYKALTAIRLAHELTERGADAVPVFWLATEDHDLAEVSHCFWSTGRGMERLELALGEEAEGRRVGEVVLGEAVSALVNSAADALEGPGAEAVGQALRESYRGGDTLGSGFGRLTMRLLGHSGIILLDPLDLRLRRLVTGIYRRTLEQNEVLAEELQARTKMLERMGYHAQVKVSERGTLLFINIEGRRVPLRRRNGRFVAGQSTFSAKELEEVIERTPEALSASVLLRSVVQDTLLPTVGYVGGPAEVAYFAQAEAVYRQLQARMPAIVPRAGFTLVEPAIARLLKKYHLELGDLFRGRQSVRARMEREYLSRRLLERFARGEKTIRQVLKALRRPLGKLDRTLEGALDTAERKMLYQFQKLREKAGRAANLRTGVLDRHERALLDTLYPNRGLQERTLNLLPFLARQGLELLDELERRASPGGMNHQVLFL